VVINLPTEGLARRDFETLAPTGTLAFTYAGRRLFSFLDFLCFLAALAGGWYLLARRPWPRLRIGLAIVLVPLTLSWFASGPITEVLASLTAGSILAVVGFLAMQLTAQLREQRAARLALAPDPFLEEAAARPSARPGAPAAHPAPPPPAAPTSPPAAEEKSEDAPGTPGTPPPDSPPSKRKKKED
jgi:hypothetical protein